MIVAVSSSCFQGNSVIAFTLRQTEPPPPPRRFSWRIFQFISSGKFLSLVFFFSALALMEGNAEKKGDPLCNCFRYHYRRPPSDSGGSQVRMNLIMKRRSNVFYIRVCSIAAVGLNYVPKKAHPVSKLNSFCDKITGDVFANQQVFLDRRPLPLPLLKSGRFRRISNATVVLPFSSLLNRHMQAFVDDSVKYPCTMSVHRVKF